MAQPVEPQPDALAQGEASYRRWREELRADPEYRAIYEEEAAKGELWPQLVEARQAAGLTQAELGARLTAPPTVRQYGSTSSACPRSSNPNWN
jgi:hypothetical protein